MGIHEYIWVYMVIHGYTRVDKGILGYTWVYMDIQGYREYSQDNIRSLT